MSGLSAARLGWLMLANSRQPGSGATARAARAAARDQLGLNKPIIDSASALSRASPTDAAKLAATSRSVNAIAVILRARVRVMYQVGQAAPVLALAGPQRVFKGVQT